jgi:hypothetical protein
MSMAEQDRRRETMDQPRRHLTYANVMSTLAVFLLLAGGTALAAKQLGKKTVGAKQLKSNAVTTPKIKKAAVTKAKIKDGAVDSTKLADNSVTSTKIVDGAVTAADINSSTVPYSQITTRLRNTSTVPLAPGTVYPLGSYTQQPGEDNQLLASVDIQFAASCSPPRLAQVILLRNAAKPAEPEVTDFYGVAVVQDLNAGAVTRRVDMSPFFIGIPQAFNKMSPNAPATDTFTLFLSAANCGAGSGVNVTGAALDVISTK